MGLHTFFSLFWSLHFVSEAQQIDRKCSEGAESILRLRERVNGEGAKVNGEGAKVLGALHV